MNNLATRANAPEIVCSDMLGHTIRNIVELSRAYETIILLYQDDFADKPLAAWAEKDRLSLPTKVIGSVLSGIDVHMFGLEDFPKGTVIELSLRETSRDLAHQNSQKTLYRSILNELVLITVKVYSDAQGNMLLQ